MIRCHGYGKARGAEVRHITRKKNSMNKNYVSNTVGREAHSQHAANSIRFPDSEACIATEKVNWWVIPNLSLLLIVLSTLTVLLSGCAKPFEPIRAKVLLYDKTPEGFLIRSSYREIEVTDESKVRRLASFFPTLEGKNRRLSLERGRLMLSYGLRDLTVELSRCRAILNIGEFAAEMILK